MMFRFSSGSFTLRSASLTESSVISAAGSAGGASGGEEGAWGGCAWSDITSTIAGIPPREQAMRLRQIAALLVIGASPSLAQPNAAQPPAETGWEFFGLPALNFNSNEGFGYGALLDLYNYGAGVKPYRFMIRPLVLITTKGRRDVAVLFDAPKLLPTGWRLDAYAGREQQLAMPYYGVGNTTVNDTTLSDPPDDYYYRYGR